jgi:hypothetical protein
MSGLVGYKNDPVTIITGADQPNAKEWQFDNLGNITIPFGGDILDSVGTSLLAVDNAVRKTSANALVGSPTVVWTGLEPSVSSAKLFVQVECEVTGDISGPHTQVCEIVVASRKNQYLPAISVYGLVYTSTGSLMTFSAQRNVNDNIEIIGTVTGIVSTNPLVRIYSVEQISRV